MINDGIFKELNHDECQNITGGGTWEDIWYSVGNTVGKTCRVIKDTFEKGTGNGISDQTKAALTLQTTGYYYYY